MEAGFLRDINKDYAGDLDYDRTDGLMVRILWWHFAVIALLTLIIYYFQPANFYPTPFSWRNLTAGEALGAVILGFFASAAPTMLKGKMANHFQFRLVTAFSYMVYSFLLVLISGASIEMHFYLFGVWALLTLYADSRLIWFGFFLMLAHRIFLNYSFPLWLYHYGRNDVSLIAHTLFALLAAVFTAQVADNARQAVIKLKEANRLLESKISG